MFALNLLGGLLTCLGICSGTFSWNDGRTVGIVVQVGPLVPQARVLFLPFPLFTLPSFHLLQPLQLQPQPDSYIASTLLVDTTAGIAGITAWQIGGRTYSRRAQLRKSTSTISFLV